MVAHRISCTTNGGDGIIASSPPLKNLYCRPDQRPRRRSHRSCCQRYRPPCPVHRRKSPWYHRSPYRRWPRLRDRLGPHPRHQAITIAVYNISNGVQSACKNAGNTVVAIRASTGKTAHYHGLRYAVDAIAIVVNRIAHSINGSGKCRRNRITQLNHRQIPA